MVKFVIYIFYQSKKKWQKGGLFQSSTYNEKFLMKLSNIPIKIWLQMYNVVKVVHDYKLDHFDIKCSIHPTSKTQIRSDD